MKSFKQHINERDMTAISSWKKKLKNVKGLTKTQLQMLSQLPTPVLTSLINQVGMIVSQKEIEEAPLVMSDGDMLDSIWKEVKPRLEKELRRGNIETTNMIARLAKFKLTKAGQKKGRSFRYDLKR